MIVTPQCHDCRHYRPDLADRIACAAFPGWIPDDILLGKVDHREPYPGDNGIRYEPEGEAAKIESADLLKIHPANYVPRDEKGRFITMQMALAANDLASHKNAEAFHRKKAEWLRDVKGDEAGAKLHIAAADAHMMARATHDPKSYANVDMSHSLGHTANGPSDHATAAEYHKSVYQHLKSHIITVGGDAAGPTMIAARDAHWEAMHAHETAAVQPSYGPQAREASDKADALFSPMQVEQMKATAAAQNASLEAAGYKPTKPRKPKGSGGGLQFKPREPIQKDIVDLKSGLSIDDLLNDKDLRGGDNLKPLDKAAAIAFANKLYDLNLTWRDEKLTPNERGDVSTYTGAGYHEINKLLRDNEAPNWGTRAAVEERVRSIDSALAKADELPLPPGRHANVVLRGLKGKRVTKWKPGDVVVDRGFTSVSVNEGTGMYFGDSTAVIRIELPAGTKAPYINHTE